MNIWHLALQGCLKSGTIDYGHCQDTGGHIKYLLDLAQALEASQPTLRQTIVTRRFQDSKLGPEYSRRRETMGERLKLLRLADSVPGYLPKEKLWWARADFQAELFKSLEGSRSKPDLIHAHYADAGTLAAAVRKEFGIPFVYSAHSLGKVKQAESPESIGEKLDFEARVAAEEEALAEASVVIASSPNEAESQLALYENYRPRKTRILVPGTSFVPTDSAARRREEILKQLHPFLRDLSKPIVLAIARPVRRKNLSRTIEAFGSNSWLRKNANLIILAGCRDQIGDLPIEQQGEVLQLLRTSDDLSLHGSVAFPKQHSEKDIEGYYQLARDTGGLFVNAALHEPFGLTLLEATYCGLPCVATRHGGPADILKDHQNGVLINPLDIAGIGKAMARILRDASLYLKFSRSAASARESLSWHTHAKRYLSIAEEVTSRTTLRTTNQTLDSGLICSDIDNTLTGEAHSLRDLTRWLNENPIHHFVISTGRDLDDALRVLDKWAIPRPKTLVTSVGSEIYYLNRSQCYDLDEAWSRAHRASWRPEEIRQLLSSLPSLTLQKAALQRPRKIGYLVKGDSKGILATIENRLNEGGHQCEVIFSHDLYLDILPRGTSKGHALTYLQKKLSIPHERTIAAGDSRNDESMLAMAGSGIVVENGAEELAGLRDLSRIFFASRKYAAGLLEGLIRLEEVGWSMMSHGNRKGEIHEA